MFIQMSSTAEDVAMRLKSSGLLRSQGLIAGKWIEAYDKKVIEVWFSCGFSVSGWSDGQQIDGFIRCVSVFLVGKEGMDRLKGKNFGVLSFQIPPIREERKVKIS